MYAAVVLNGNILIGDVKRADDDPSSLGAYRRKLIRFLKFSKLYQPERELVNLPMDCKERVQSEEMVYL